MGKGVMPEESKNDRWKKEMRSNISCWENMKTKLPIRDLKDGLRR
jgi:hypothetical protein